MPIPSLFRTSTFRLALLAAFLFALSGLSILGFVYWNTLSVMDRQLDGPLRRDVETLATVLDQSGMAGLADAVARRIPPYGAVSRLYLLQDAQGRILAGNLHAWPAAAPPPGQTADIMLWGEADREMARVTVIGRADMAGGRLLAGRDLSERVGFGHIMQISLAAAVGLTLAIGTGVGMVMSRYALRRLDHVNQTARAILDGDLTGRVPDSGRGDEFDELAANINTMLDRIERLVVTVRGVTENIAHDLRSPLNRLRSRLEIALLNQSAEGQSRAIEAAVADADTIVATFNAMLKIARIEGTRQRPRDKVDLAPLAETMVEFYAPLAEDNNLSLMLDLHGAPTIRGDRHLISQALSNLIDNAVKYTPPGGTVTVGACQHSGGAALWVADTGPGVPEDRRKMVLERFTRLDGSRQTPGTGLGLALVAAVADVHGAKLDLSDNGPGLVVRMTFAP